VDVATLVVLPDAAELSPVDVNVAPLDADVDGPKGAIDAGTTPSVDATQVLDGASASTDGGSPTTKKFGQLSLTQGVVDQPVVGTIITAAVASFEIEGTGDSCQSLQTLGDCQFYQCQNAATAGKYLSAGNVSITGLASALTIPYMNAALGYQYSGWGSYLWNSSRPVTAVVTGSADVPAFTLDLVAPNPITLTAPTKSSGDYSFPRGTDLAVRWTGGVEGSVVVVLANKNGGVTQFLEASCSVDASKGTATVPAALLAKLPASVSLEITVVNSASKDVQDWSMTFGAIMPTLEATATLTN
jgi:hypothetical protein